MRKTTLFLIFFLVLFLVIYAWIKNSTSQNSFGGALPVSQPLSQLGKKEIFVGPHKLLIEIAGDSQKRQQGLSGRENLGDDEGMLFIFEEPDFYTFWMKDMKIPLDFIWIGGEEILDVIENVPAPTEQNNLPIYQPREKVDKVLEVNAGWVQGHGVKVGDKIKMQTD